MNKIEFTIGDWSGDGHGKTETIIVESSHPVEHLRELHFRAYSEIGIDIGSICGEYGEYEINEGVMEQLNDLGIQVSDSLGGREMIELWAALLQKVDSNVTIEVPQPTAKNAIPSMHFYGFDDKRRHLNVPGYGLFE